FNTVDLTAMSETGQLLTVILMLIGGSPSSTAGGMKTTTVGVLLLAAVSVFRQKDYTHTFGRRISDSAIRNAATIFLMYIALFLLGGMIISRVDNIPILTALYETSSAIGTVGLTLGVTPQLGLISRIILVLLMYFGRVGGLTLMFAAFSRTAASKANFPEEKITVG
ncbi:MAG TPA: TrkH family potassium uptake protein, partial [Candidatus Ventrousia excrementavium]|nr:TrkH family potassium uptake protein [Candidatus Ventrousia excrementavium]